MRDMLDFLEGLLAIDSPTGMTDEAITFTEGAFTELGLACSRTRKGALLVTWPGEEPGPARALTAHVDTLGAIVTELKEHGRVALSPIGGLPAEAAEGAYVRVYTEAGPMTGTILSTRASAHIFGARAHELERTFDNLEVRLDASAPSREELEALGVRVGDFIALEPQVQRSPSGYLKSRFLDDKSGVACLYSAAADLIAAGHRPLRDTALLISCYEEVGHGSPAGLPDVAEFVAVDMAAQGPGQASSEHAVTICAKDASGPYDLSLRRRLVQLAEDAGLRYVVDTYRYYASDASQAHRAGRDVRTALIGPGVDASHAYERVHDEGLQNTRTLIARYLLAST